MISRRWVPVALLGVILVAAFGVALAQTSKKVYRLGFITPSRHQAREDVFRAELRRLGLVEGQNLVTEYRSAEGNVDRLPQLAAELVRGRVDVIAAVLSQASLAAKKATDTIPIVMIGASDPVGTGLIASLERPGANVTGTATISTDILSRQLDLVRELRPRASRLGVLWNPANTAYQRKALGEIRAAAKRLQIGLQIAEARGAAAFDRAFATIAGQHVDALLVVGDPLFAAHLPELAELGVKHGLLTIGGPREYAEHGILMTYGPSFGEAHRLAAAYVDRILRGARPANLPVVEVRSFDLVLNARTARALGVTLPESLLTRADEVIQ